MFIVIYFIVKINNRQIEKFSIIRRIFSIWLLLPQLNLEDFIEGAILKLYHHLFSRRIVFHLQQYPIFMSSSVSVQLAYKHTKLFSGDFGD